MSRELDRHLRNLSMEAEEQAKQPSDLDRLRKENEQLLEVLAKFVHRCDHGPYEETDLPADESAWAGIHVSRELYDSARAALKLAD